MPIDLLSKYLLSVPVCKQYASTKTRLVLHELESSGRGGGTKTKHAGNHIAKQEAVLCRRSSTMCIRPLEEEQTISIHLM